MCADGSYHSFPLHDNINELYIGFKKDVLVEAVTPYRHATSIVMISSGGVLQKISIPATRYYLADISARPCRRRQNVYFIDGGEIFAGEDWDACTVDGSSLNDLGLFHYADCLEKYLRPLLS